MQTDQNKEKCAKCLKELGWKNMYVHEYLNEWLCPSCEVLYEEAFKEFKNKWLNHERTSIVYRTP